MKKVNKKKFQEKIDNGKKVISINNGYCVDNKEEKEEDCPFCSTVKKVLEDILKSTDYDEQFGILHSVINKIREIGYQEGHVDCLRNQAEILDEMADELDNEFFGEDEIPEVNPMLLVKDKNVPAKLEGIQDKNKGK